MDIVDIMVNQIAISVGKAHIHQATRENNNNAAIILSEYTME